MRRSRYRFSCVQLLVLENQLLCDPYPTLERRQQIAEEIGTESRNVRVWFQNRRQRGNIKKVTGDQTSTSATNEAAHGTEAGGAKVAEGAGLSAPVECVGHSSCRAIHSRPTYDITKEREALTRFFALNVPSLAPFYRDALVHDMMLFDSQWRNLTLTLVLQWLDNYEIERMYHEVLTTVM